MVERANRSPFCCYLDYLVRPQNLFNTMWWNHRRVPDSTQHQDKITCVIEDNLGRDYLLIATQQYLCIYQRIIILKTRNPTKMVKQKARKPIQFPCLMLKPYISLARREGLEPPTYWFVASHSIQLSYRRILFSSNCLYIIPHLTINCKHYF